MDNSLKALILAAGVVITCVVVGLGFFVSREAKNFASDGISQMNGIMSEYSNVNAQIYDGLRVSGQEVINVIEKYTGEPDMSIIVKRIDNQYAQYINTLTASVSGSGSGSPVTLDDQYFEDPLYILSEIATPSGNLYDTYDRSTANTATNYINNYGEFLGRVFKDGNGNVTTIYFEQLR